MATAALVLVTNFLFNSSFAVLGAILPDVAADLGVTESTAAWSVLLPMLVAAGLQPATGMFADMFGRKKVWLFGYAINVVSALICGTSRSFAWLCAGRLLQGAGASLDMPTGVAMMMEAYGRDNRGMVLAAFTASNTAGSSAGLIVGGLLAERFGWRSLFLLPLPPVVVLLAIAVCVLRESGGGMSWKKALAVFDWAGLLLLVLACLGMLIGVNNLASAPLLSVRVLLPVALSVPLSAALGWVELRNEREGATCILRPSLFTKETALALLGNCFRMATYLGLFTVIPLMLRDYYGLHAGKAAALLTVRPFVYGICSILSGKLVQTFPAAQMPLIAISTWMSIVDKFLLLLMAYTAGDSLKTALLQILLVVQGSANGLADTAVKTLVVQSTPPEFTANMQGVLNMSSIVSYLNGINIAVALADSQQQGLGEHTAKPYITAAWVFLALYMVNVALVTFLFIT
eukprot:CAMPEP_0119151322 /NCGR_PEP_ID=MMETSP1310-20130426/46164_1 /TAXON_ID=464262 /ORGANISM="Genus nov. species nov., Strain RCC2339" /LENGTH=459 /DNA_ID=CAMNT_0007143589 /DNA_START=1 /DNA_END=1377 /DNA_ORIENTATION=-